MSTQTAFLQPTSPVLTVSPTFIERSHVKLYMRTAAEREAGLEFINSSLQTEGIDYTWDNDGIIRPIPAPDGTRDYFIQRDTPAVALAIQQPGVLSTAKLNLADEQSRLMAEEAKDQTRTLSERAFTVPYGEIPPQLPSAGVRAGKLLGFDESGAPLLDIQTSQVRELLGLVFSPVLTGLSSLVAYVATGIGAMTRSVQDKLRENVSPEDFGAIGDGLSHPLSERYATLAEAQAVYPFAYSLDQQIDYCAIYAATHSRLFTSFGIFYFSGPRVWLGDGKVYFCGADTFQFKRSVTIEGSGSGMAWSSTAALKFSPGTTGIVVHRVNTFGAGTTPNTTGGDGSIFRGFRLLGARGTPDALGGHGIWYRSRAKSVDLFIDGFEGDGHHINATAGSPFPATEGNANLFQIHGGRVQYCNNGVYATGADANAGFGVGIDVSNNRRWGIYDASFLGNGWSYCHADSNGVEFGELPGGGFGPIASAFASFGGLTYQAVPGTSNAALVATQPGTNRNIWRKCNNTSFAIAWTPGMPSGTYRTGGAYHSDNLNSRVHFEGIYSEGGQGLLWGGQHSLFVGGFVIETPVVTGAAIEGRNNRIFSRQGYVSAGLTDAEKEVSITIGGDANNGDIFQWYHSDDGSDLTWRFQRAGADWAVTNANTLARMPYQITGENTLLTFGTSLPKPFLLNIPTLAIGRGALGRRHTTGTAAPTTGDWAVGDIVFNVGVAAGGKIGWVCTVAGTPGTWKEWGSVDA